MELKEFLHRRSSSIALKKESKVRDCSKTDIFSAIIRASKQFGAKTIAIVDGDGTEVDYKTILRGSFALGSALGKKFKKGRGILLLRLGGLLWH